MATIIVADRISTAAREELSRVGLAWFDRRGHLWVRAPGLFVNAEVSSGSVMPSRRVVSVFRGTGLDVALALLVYPSEPQGVHAVARQIDRPRAGCPRSCLSSGAREWWVQTTGRSCPSCSGP